MDVVILVFFILLGRRRTATKENWSSHGNGSPGIIDSFLIENLWRFPSKYLVKHRNPSLILKFYISLYVSKIMYLRLLLYPNLTKKSRQLLRRNLWQLQRRQLLLPYHPLLSPLDLSVYPQRQLKYLRYVHFLFLSLKILIGQRYHRTKFIRLPQIVAVKK